MRLAIWPVLIPALVLAACSPAGTVKKDQPAEAEAPLTITPSGPPPSTEAIEGAIASINPLENDLRNLEVAVRLADPFEVKDDGAVLLLQVKSDTQGLLVDERFTLARAPGAANSFTEALAVPGFTLHPFKLAPADGERMAAAQARMLEIREAAPGQNELTFEAAVFSCVGGGQPAPETYKFGVYVRSAPTVEYVSLGGDMEVARGNAGTMDDLFNPCPA
jgi:hypothetical protein